MARWGRYASGEVAQVRGALGGGDPVSWIHSPRANACVQTRCGLASFARVSPMYQWLATKQARMIRRVSDIIVSAAVRWKTSPPTPDRWRTLADIPSAASPAARAIPR